MFADRVVILEGKIKDKGRLGLWHISPRVVQPLPVLSVHIGRDSRHLASNGDTRYRAVMIPLTDIERKGSTKTHHFQRVRADRLKTIKQHSLAL